METKAVTMGGKTWMEYRVHLKLDDAARRAAIWMGITRNGKGIEGRVEITPRGKNSPLRTLIILRDGAEIGRIGVTAFSKYFVYSERNSDKKYYVHIELDEKGVHLWEREGDNNWWALADVFFSAF